MFQSTPRGGTEQLKIVKSLFSTVRGPNAMIAVRCNRLSSQFVGLLGWPPAGLGCALGERSCESTQANSTMLANVEASWFGRNWRRNQTSMPAAQHFYAKNTLLSLKRSGQIPSQDENEAHQDGRAQKGHT